MELIQILYTQIEKNIDFLYSIKKELLLYRGYFVIPDIDILCINLIRETYKQILLTYPGRDKIYQILHVKYY